MNMFTISSDFYLNSFIFENSFLNGGGVKVGPHSSVISMHSGEFWRLKKWLELWVKRRGSSAGAQ